jgi:predicted PurR-regulated permease PerM
VLVALAAGAGLFLAWQTAGTLLLLFAGLLFGSFLDAAARGLAHALLALAAASLAAWGGYNLVAQADGLVAVIGEQLRALRGELRDMGIAPPPGPEGEPRTLAQLLLPDPGTLFGTAYSAFSLASGLLGNAIVVVFVGLFAAADPGTYRRGALALLPHDRRRRVARSSTRWPPSCAGGWSGNWWPWS